MKKPLERDEVIQGLLRRVRALGNRRTRDHERCLWIEGIRNFVRAHDAALHFEVIVHSEILLQSDCAEMLGRKLAARGVRRVRVRPEEFRRFSIAERASGIGAIVRQHWTGLGAIQPATRDFVVVVEEIRSAGNLGTILRTAEACGAAGVIFVGPACDPFDPAVVRASMGGVFDLRLVRATAGEVGQWAAARGVRLVGMSPRAGRLWTELPHGTPIALVLGEERRGLTETLTGLCDWAVRLPIVGKADSLNVSVAAGVAMYEVVRRRGEHPQTAQIDAD